MHADRQISRHTESVLSRVVGQVSFTSGKLLATVPVTKIWEAKRRPGCDLHSLLIVIRCFIVNFEKS